MLSVPLVLICLLLGAVLPSAGFAQDDPAKTDSDAFFSGTVMEIAADHVTVSRTILGKPAERRTFKITEQTKVEGKLKAKSRVTVRYAATDEGDVALSILVRERDQKSELRKR